MVGGGGGKLSLEEVLADSRVTRPEVRVSAVGNTSKNGIGYAELGMTGRTGTALTQVGEMEVTCHAGAHVPGYQGRERQEGAFSRSFDHRHFEGLLGFRWGGRLD